MQTRTRRHTCLAAFVLLLLVSGGPSGASGNSEYDDVTDQILLELQPGVAIETIEQRYNVTEIDDAPELRIWQVQIAPGADIVAIVELMKDDDDLKRAERHRRIETPESVQRSVPDLGIIADQNDYLGQGAGIDIKRIRAHQRFIGTGITIAALDTGVAAGNPAISGHVQLPGVNMLGGDGSTSPQPNGIDDDLDGMIDEALNHGTYVVGLLHLGAPGAMLMPVRLLDEDGFGTTFTVARGILAAVAAGADVINLSFGMEEDSRVVEQAIEYAIDHGVVIVAAAGNDGLGFVSFPANLPDVIAVAALDTDREKADFSNFGPQVDIGAPGTDLISSWGDDFAGWSGTSFASPLVAAGAALLLEKYPGLTPAEVRDAIRATAAPDNTGPSYAGLMGAGILDLNALTKILLVDRESLKLTPSPEGSAISFSPVLDVTRYDVARGEVGNLSLTGLQYGDPVDLGPLACVSNDSIFTWAVDPAVPEPGVVYFYVFRDDGLVDGQSYGKGSRGRPRIPGNTDCPGD